VVRDVLDYLDRDMVAVEGGFRTATDADSEGEEGKFFVWTPAELRAALDDAHARAATAYWNVTEPGNFHGKHLLHVARALPDVARDLDLDAGALRRLLDEERPRLY